ncbi:hypothetical protein ES731_15470 [Psychroflexus gondwanensis]|jgi:hypothetical protein|uniref:Uncharacterized protein n=1 Tax=Brumimicrobium glaciale TaxID=200475 RepID=A0A4Q4KPF1_9FLAO|nr:MULTISPECIES: hypothetical protein [Flavobacteriales]RYM35408.1 hypothetical protein ERX46_00005 [Brumimicrobium glaciale]TXE15301.1 hypothetical protein ES731_15470 [Psychroflexus gondwanensis]
MRIQYKKRQLNFNLIFGIIWLSYFFVKLFFDDKLDWIDYGWILISLAYLLTYFYQKKYKYVTIENGILTVNGPFGKKLNLTEIKRIKKFAGDYILKTDKEELTINTQIIEPNSLAELNAELEKLKIEWN